MKNRLTTAYSFMDWTANVIRLVWFCGGVAGGWIAKGWMHHG